MPSKSLLPALDIPEADIVTFLFERNIPFPPNKDAETKQSYTFVQVKKTAQALGRALILHWNWPKGDVLAIFTPNCIDTPVITFGTLWAAGVVSPVNPAYTVDELTAQLRNSAAKAIATQAAAKRVGIPDNSILLLGRNQTVTDGDSKHFWDLLRKDTGNIRLVPKNSRPKIDPKGDLAFLVYSSGTTGLPKGVMLSHTNIVTNILQIDSVDGRYLTWKRDSVLAFLPLFHIYGLTCHIHQPLYAGYHTIIMFCAYIQNYQITFSYVVPPVLLLLTKHPIVDKYRLSSLRMLHSGAVPLSRDLALATARRINVPVKQGYGLSETSPVTHMQLWDDWSKYFGSIGKLMPNMEAKYRTIGIESSKSDSELEQLHEVPIGKIGELYLRGPNIFQGYYQQVKATSKCLSAEGWLSGRAWQLYITDRIKKLIKYKGSQVAPAELEGLLSYHKDVNDVAVIGVDSPARGTEVPRAYIVRTRSKDESFVSDEDCAAEIICWLNFRVAQHKRLRGGIRFVDAIPKSVSGKILRRTLRAQAQKEADAVNQANL
ncbi:putative phenylacetyl-CoA ligase [Talaromyces proteolyticus]|uniref:Phenylacetyl-CoA ligase n=1 Tax=Talaromyces proteolyticus TaxID=1131652 RepID=A0AAD4Q163_9EURO|nr:putative phenylacetyl-CoA ligase [Talaromyces proteolyticus]KAH8697923.1 putative phenylacetyl-CoA ligase [Talaromyces proteolyticus]